MLLWDEISRNWRPSIKEFLSGLAQFPFENFGLDLTVSPFEELRSLNGSTLEITRLSVKELWPWVKWSSVDVKWPPFDVIISPALSNNKVILEGSRMIAVSIVNVSRFNHDTRLHASVGHDGSGLDDTFHYLYARLYRLWLLSKVISDAISLSHGIFFPTVLWCACDQMAED